MQPEQIAEYIATVGFPIVITFYLLIRLEGKISELNKTLLKISAVIEKCKK